MSKSKRKPTDAEWVAAQKGPTPEQRVLLAQVERLRSENEKLSRTLGLVEAYRAAAGTPPPWAKAERGKRDRDAATACMLLSDLHLDEVVNPAEVGGLNAYDRPIAERRLRRWAAKACELGERYRHRWDGALVAVDGDMVSGAIHEELAETNADVLPGTLVHWAPLLAAALRAVADFYGRIHVPVVVGNHGRLTKQKPAKRRGRASWDWLLMQMVRSHLAEDERITWDFAQGTYLFVPIYEQHALLTHGDEVGGGSGWASIWTPLMTIHRKGSEMASAHGLRIAYSMIGHWHQLVMAHQRGICLNGSMKGRDEYASFLRLGYEPALQAWWVHAPDRGVTLAAPLFVEDRADEGW